MYAFAASLFAALMTTVGILTVRRVEKRRQIKTIYFVSFAAGILISATLLHIIPEAIDINASAPAYLLAGFFLFYLLSRFVTTHDSDEPGAEAHSEGLTPVIGIGIHSFLDGIIYAVTFSVSAFTGVVTGLGMVLHEVPEGIITYALLLRAGVEQRRAVGLALLIAGATTPLGTLLAFPFVAQIEGPPLGAMLAVTGGVLLYVGTSHLLPQTEHEKTRYNLLMLAAGIAVAVLIFLTE